MILKNINIDDNGLLTGYVSFINFYAKIPKIDIKTKLNHFQSKFC